MRPVINAFIVILVIGLILAGLTYANYRFSAENPGGNDFLARWMGARYWLVNGISPYDEQVSLASQQIIYGHPADPSIGEDKNHFVYPLTSMIFFGPFGLLDYVPARAIWMTVLELSLIGLAVVSIRLADWKPSAAKVALLLLFSLLWYHSARSIILGQFAALNAFLIALSLLLIYRNQDFIGGLLVSVSLVKPQMSIFFVLYVLIWAISVRRREILLGVLSGVIIQFGVTLALMPDWPLQWIRQVLDYPSYTNTGSPLSVIANAVPGIRQPVILFLNTVFLGYMAIEWFISWKKNVNQFIWTAMLTLVITNMVAFRTATTNYLSFMSVLFYIFAVWEKRWGGIGRFFVTVSLSVLAVGLWILFLFTVQGNLEQPIMYLPVPFICLLGLWWVRWYAIKPPRLMIDDLSDR